MIRALILFAIFQIFLIKTYAQTEQVAAGVQKITAGVPDKFTPYRFCQELPMKAALEKLPAGRLPFNIADIKITINNRGIIVAVPLADSEQLYGFGLQFGSFNQRGLKIRPLVNDNPLNDAGYTHGPATFYVSNKGYGILVNTSRYTTFYCGNTVRVNVHNIKASGNVTVDIPGAKGIEVFIFEGPDLKNALQRYNLFAGGGALPAIWGLGVKYRVKARFQPATGG